MLPSTNGENLASTQPQKIHPCECTHGAEFHQCECIHGAELYHGLCKGNGLCCCGQVVTTFLMPVLEEHFWPLTKVYVIITCYICHLWHI